MRFVRKKLILHYMLNYEYLKVLKKVLKKNYKKEKSFEKRIMCREKTVLLATFFNMSALFCFLTFTHCS